jgi:hypothetical protein
LDNWALNPKTLKIIQGDDSVQVKTFGKKYMCKLDSVSNPWKAFFRLPKTFSTIKCCPFYVYYCREVLGQSVVLLFCMAF